MEKRVINALISMGAPMKTKGTKYIVDAMGVYDSSENWTNVKTMALYEEIAKNNKTTLLRVERNIRHVFLGLVTKGNIEAVERYLGKNSRGNTNRLATLYIRLKQEENNERSID